MKLNKRMNINIAEIKLAKELFELEPLERKEPTQKAKDELRKGW